MKVLWFPFSLRSLLGKFPFFSQYQGALSLGRKICSDARKHHGITHLEAHLAHGEFYAPNFKAELGWNPEARGKAAPHFSRGSVKVFFARKIFCFLLNSISQILGGAPLHWCARRILTYPDKPLEKQTSTPSCLNHSSLNTPVE